MTYTDLTTKLKMMPYLMHAILGSITTQVIASKDGNCYFKDTSKELSEACIIGVIARCGDGCTYKGNPLPSEQLMNRTHLYLRIGNEDTTCGHPMSHFSHQGKVNAPGEFAPLVMPNGFNVDKSYITICCDVFDPATGETSQLPIPPGTAFELTFITCPKALLCL